MTEIQYVFQFTPNIAWVYYIEMLHKITNRNIITLVRYLKSCNTPVIGYISMHNYQLPLYKWIHFLNHSLLPFSPLFD